MLTMDNPQLSPTPRRGKDAVQRLNGGGFWRVPRAAAYSQGLRYSLPSGESQQEYVLLR